MKLRKFFLDIHKFPIFARHQLELFLEPKKFPSISYTSLINFSLEMHLTVAQFMSLESLFFRQNRLVFPVGYEDILDGINIPSTVFSDLDVLFNYFVNSKIAISLKTAIINELYLRYAQKCSSINDFQVLFHVWRLLPPNMNSTASFQYIFSKLVNKLYYDTWVQPIFLYISKMVLKTSDSKINLNLIKFIAKQFSSYGHLTVIQTIISAQMRLFLSNNNEDNDFERIWLWITCLDEESLLLPEYTLEFWIFLNSKLPAKKVLLPNYFLSNKQRFFVFFPQLIANIPVKKILKQNLATKYTFFEFCEHFELHFDLSILILYLTLNVNVPLKDRWKKLLNIWIKEELQLQNQIIRWQNVSFAYRNLQKSIRKVLLSETGNFFRSITFQRFFYAPQNQTQIIQLTMGPLIYSEPDISLQLFGLKIVFKHFKDNDSLIPFFIPTWRKFYDDNCHIPQLQAYMINVLRDIWLKVLDKFRLNPHALRIWIAELFRFQELQVQFSHELIQQLHFWVSDKRITTIEKYEFLNYLQTLSLSDSIRPQIETLYQKIELSRLKLRILPEISTNNLYNHLEEDRSPFDISDKEREHPISFTVSSLEVHHYSTVRCIACRREIKNGLDNVKCSICNIIYCLECSKEWGKNALYCLNVFPLHNFNSK